MPRKENKPHLYTRIAESGKRGVTHAVFGRGAVVVLLLVFQLLLLFGFFFSFAQYLRYYVGAILIFTAVILFHILNTKGDPSVKLSWCIVIALLPVFGVLLYAYTQLDLGHRMEQKVLQKAVTESAPYISDQSVLMEQVRTEDIPGYVIPYGDSPLDEENVGETVYLDILNRAKDHVYIMTPYLILDNEMLNALKFAAKRGVDVRLILPHIPDKKYAFALAKSHYQELTEAGVKLYEYTPGFMHAKVWVSDNTHAVVGTINLDYRSLYLHFECAAYMYRVPAIRDILDDFEDTFAKSQPVTAESIQNEKFTTKLAGRLLKVAAPLM